MVFLEHYFFWASNGCPDAMPAGIIAVKLGQNAANHNDQEIQEIRNDLCRESFFDDATLQLDFTGTDKDLICRDSDPHFLCSSQIVADWQWELIKGQPGLRCAEHDLEEHYAEMERFLRKEGEDD